jgi:hypothetical protein
MFIPAGMQGVSKSILKVEIVWADKTSVSLAECLGFFMAGIGYS